MREEVIVYVKTELKSDDEEEIDPGCTDSSPSRYASTSDEDRTGTDRNANITSPECSSQSWPCAVCGQLFPAREEVLEHLKTDHAEQLMQEYIKRVDDSIQQRLVALRNAQAAVAQQQARFFANLAKTQMITQQPLFGLNNIQQSVFAMKNLPLPVPFPVPSNPPSRSGSGIEARRGRPRHPVWSLFARLDKFDAECTLCKSRVRSACPTNLCRHLNNNHCDIAAKLFAEWKKEKESSGGSFLHARHSVTPKKKEEVTVPLENVLRHQKSLLEQKERPGLSKDVIMAIDRQLAINAKIISDAQIPLERKMTAMLERARKGGEDTGQPSTSTDTRAPVERQGVIRFGGTTRRCSPAQTVSTSIDVLSVSPTLEEPENGRHRAASEPAPESGDSEPDPKQSAKARPGTAPPMIAVMDYDTLYMQGYQEGQPIVQDHQLQAAALRQPNQNFETWFATAYHQPIPLDAAAAVMNTGYGTLPAGMEATITPATAFPDLKPEQLIGISPPEEHPPLFAASSSTHDELQFRVKQELLDPDERAYAQALGAPTTSTAGNTPAKRGRPTENPCWEYFERMDDSLVKCRTCEKVVKSACATNMTKHLERHHHDEYLQLTERLKSSRLFKQTLSSSGQTAGSSGSTSAQQPPQQQQQAQSSSMALNHLTHQPNHHLLQPMSADGQLLGHQLAHQLPLSPDPSPAAQHCLFGNQPFLKFQDHSLRADQMLLLHTTDGLIPAVDPSSHYVTADFYHPFDNRQDNSLMNFDDAWQTRTFAPVATGGYDQWGNVTGLQNDQGTSNMIMDQDVWQQATALSTLQHPTVIQSTTANTGAGGNSSADASSTLTATTVAQLPVTTSESSASSSSSIVSAGTGASGAPTAHNQSPPSTNRGTTNHEGKPYMKRNRKTEHPVWEFFKRTADGNAQCSICTGIVKSPCSSNFMRHLMRHHSVEYNNVYAKWSQKRGPASMKSAY